MSMTPKCDMFLESSWLDHNKPDQTRCFQQNNFVLNGSKWFKMVKMFLYGPTCSKKGQNWLKRSIIQNGSKWSYMVQHGQSPKFAKMVQNGQIVSKVLKIMGLNCPIWWKILQKFDTVKLANLNKKIILKNFKNFKTVKKIIVKTVKISGLLKL